jgi:riboflavin synthase
MFTGLIETTGRVTSVKPRGSYLRIMISPDAADFQTTTGESIAVSGPCLTVSEPGGEAFAVEASPETLATTTLSGVRPGRRVNLERALRADSPMGGHYVTGHVDAALVARRVVRAGESLRIEVELPQAFAPLVVDKGSVALDGVSLTVVRVGPDDFAVNIIPETRKRTTLSDLRAGDPVNVEFDIMAKYIARFLSTSGHGRVLSQASMRDMGY